ncbi:AMP-binding protein [Albimonas sp. CAU 1670]|uniref:AMP-binding protein n=1 Tax=Albimonas sp. CAU 1670 TaxID=3032599 RepID=UPI0023DBC71B|nr:AMP-binding protein [Albimonas sp. CAU 1670]MDF2234119.1 AMP-binding protein [Albimonas sp. CAU 1670]
MAYHLDPRMPAPEQVIIRDLIDRHAAEQPAKTYAVFPDMSEWTYAQMKAQVVQTAIGLQRLGVKQGEHVLVWLPNGPDILRVWYALAYIGAVFVPINTAYKGKLLEHVVENSDASLIVVHAQLTPRLADVDRAKLKTAVVIGGAPEPVADLEMQPADVLAPEGGELAPLERPIALWDTQAIIYTSGTTGPSKGVLSSYMQLWACTTVAEALPSDRQMVNLPMFHVGGTFPSYRMLQIGASISMIESFKTEEFWDVVRRTGTTYVILLGVMAQFLAKQPPKPDDADNPLRRCLIIPYDFDTAAFAKRFGVDTYTMFNMTEISCPLVSELNSTVLHAAGRPRPGVEARVVDENDCEVAVGEVGELVLRTDAPWAMTHGYYKNPEATAKSWRNGWFHTGDGFRVDAEGNFYFVDRMKDAIRRRGENISSYEVEAEVLAHPDVAECAVVAVKSEVSEDEVLAVVAPVAGKTLDPKELLEFLLPRMAHFMVPRYVRIVDELPRTPTAKVRKIELREAGVTPDAWDREAAGIRVRREKIGA